MSSFSLVKVEDRTVFPTKLNYNFNRGFDPSTGLLTSGLSGSVSIEFDLEEETDTNTFFATWFLEKKPKLLTLEINPAAGNQKFLTVELEDAIVVGYTITQDSRVDATTTQNGFVQLVVAASGVNIGQAGLTMGQ